MSLEVDANWCLISECFISLQIITELYRELEEKENEMENSDYERKKEDDLQRRLSEAYSHAFHQELVRLTVEIWS